jgi:Protein of unknown function (DUF2637)
MSDPRTAHTRPPGDGSRALRLLGLAAVAVGVLLLVAAAFVLSYAGIHAVALSAGVSPRLARLYPVIFDAMLVVACAAVLSLRGAGLPSRCYAWLTMLVLVVAAAGADTLHATGASLPRKPAAAAAAIIPWALVLIGFGLLLAILRQARLRLAAGQDDEGLLEPSGRAEVSGGIDVLFGPRPSSAPDGLPAGSGFRVLAEPPAPAVSPAPNGFPARDQPPARADSTTLGESPAPGFVPVPAGPEAEADAGPEPESAEREPESVGPEPELAGTGPAGEGEEPSPAPALATAQFDRMQSSPVPPGARSAPVP